MFRSAYSAGRRLLARERLSANSWSQSSRHYRASTADGSTNLTLTSSVAAAYNGILTTPRLSAVMHKRRRSLSDCDIPPDEFYAIYVRTARRQRFMRLPRSPFKRSACDLVVDAFRSSKLSPALVCLVLILIAVPDQKGSAAHHGAWQRQAQTGKTDYRDSPGNNAWSRYLVSGRQCRSSIDGSNTDVVHQVRARMPRNVEFSHIVTTLWPRKGADYELTMMFRAGRGVVYSEVREARAAIDPFTCHARLLSIT